MTIKSDQDLFFQFRCEQGLKARGLSHLPQYQERLAYEIEVIKQFSFCGYFCVVSDLLNWARANQIPVGHGRGSVAGSLAAYCLWITQLDPLKYGLLFERFLNAGRAEVGCPDIDLDFCELRRDEVIEYVAEKYGAERVAHVGTFGTMKAKGAIRDITRTLGLPYELGDRLAGLTLDPIEGKSQTLATCYEKVPELKNLRFGEPSQERTILEWAERMEERPRAQGVHASGVVIANQPVAQVAPLYLGKGGEITTQWDMRDDEEAGLVKFDFLGLRALTTIDRCLQLIKKNHGIEIDLLSVSVDDPKVYQLLQEGEADFLFQLEGSTGMRDLLVKVRPTCLEDISAILSIYRPGPLGTDALEKYLQVRAGETTPSYLTEELEPILASTNGMLIYQEQIMEICRVLAGYTLQEADEMRKIIGKKLEKKMPAQHDKFVKGCVANGISEYIANKLFDDIKGFATYSFNKSHAISYGYLTYQTAWLKTYYPLEFICSCLISDSDESEKIIQYINYCQNKGILIEGPDVNESGTSFALSPDGKSIRFGLAAIKNLGKPVEEIIQERNEEGPFTDILNFASRVDLTKVNKMKLESLVLSGAFDSVDGSNRASMLAAIQEILDYKEQQKRWESKYNTYLKRIDAFEERKKQIALYDVDSSGFKKRPAMLSLPEPPPEVPKPVIPSRIELPKSEILSHEKELLGYYISGHPLDQVTEKSKFPISLIKEKATQRQKLTLIAIPSSFTETTTKKKKAKMAHLELEDKTGTIQAVVFPKPYAMYQKLIDIATPARYEVEVEITEGDVGRLVKLMILEVSELESVKAAAALPIDISVGLSSAEALSKTIAPLLGGKTLVNLSVESTQKGYSWKFGEIACRGDRSELTKKLRG